MKRIAWLTVLTLVITVILFAQQIKAGDWPMLAHDRYHLGSTNEILQLPLTLNHSLVAGGNIMFSSQPIVEGCIAYLGGVGHCIKAYNFCTGEILWEFCDTERDLETPCIYGDYLYVSADYGQSSGSRIYKINKLTGDMLLFADVPAQPQPPCVLNGVVYLGYGYYGSGPFGMTALDADDFSTLWNYPNPANHTMNGPAVSSDGAKLYSGDNGGNFRCLNASTGTQIWSYSTGLSWGTPLPTLSDSIVYFEAGGANTNVYALTADSGTLLWQKHLEMNYAGPSQTQAVFNNILYISSDVSLYALDLLNSGDILWTFQADGGCWAPSVAGGVVFVTTDEDGGIYALDGNDGNVLWSHHCGGSGPQFAGPVIANGHLLFYYMSSDKADSSILYDFSSAQQIPTLSEWGLIIFGVVLLGFISWVFLKRRKVVANY
jgi:outer membrane protein assembly factor BamB